MTKALEALKDIGRFPIDDEFCVCDIDEYAIAKAGLERLEELEKVLKIVKEKKVNIFYLMLYQSYYEYNDKFDRDLTETEFNLLKEYFK